jgi:branched-chain amino acid transport system substrate-binding protein
MLIIVISQSLSASIKIGVIVIQGQDSSALTGMKLAVAGVNQKGGVLGQPLELVVKSATAQPAVIQATTQELAEKTNVLVSINDQNSASMIAAGLTNRALVSMQYDASMAQKDIYSLMPAISVQAVASAQYIFNQMHRKTALLLYPLHERALTLQARYFQAAFKKMGGSVRAQFAYEQQLSPLFIEQIKAHKYDVVYLTATEKNVGFIIKQLRELNLRVPLIGNDSFATLAISKMNSAVANDLYYTTNGFYDTNFNSDELNKFIQIYQKANQKKPTSFMAASGYDAIQIIVKAIKKAKSAEPTAIKQTLGTIADFSGLSGDYDFTTYPAIKSVSMVKIIKGKKKLAAIVIAQFIPPVVNTERFVATAAATSGTQDVKV